MEKTGGLRVLMVDDHPIVRQGLRLLLENEGIEMCGEAETVDSAIASVAEGLPDLVLVDLCLGSEDGLDLVRYLAAERPALPVLVYSGFEDPVHAERALSAGAGGYVTKCEAYLVLTHAIRECAAGRRYLSPRILESMAEASLAREGIEALSLQERQVYDLLGQAFSTSAIAARLDLSPRTVESYFVRIQTKIGCKGMKDLRRQAVARPI